jgi:hypothetical protein
MHKIRPVLAQKALHFGLGAAALHDPADSPTG